MNRNEILALAKPILFNTDMVKAILDGRKTQTRRVIKTIYFTQWENVGFTDEYIKDPENCVINLSQYKVGDILYVKETWADEGQTTRYDDDGAAIHHEHYYGYKERIERMKWGSPMRWRPSIHMPKEAARIFLEITDVRIERLQDIMKSPPGKDNEVVREGFSYGCDFIAVWNSTIKKSDLSRYGWNTNPWVWVYEFKKIQIE